MRFKFNIRRTKKWNRNRLGTVKGDQLADFMLRGRAGIKPLRKFKQPDQRKRSTKG